MHSARNFKKFNPVPVAGYQSVLNNLARIIPTATSRMAFYHVEGLSGVSSWDSVPIVNGNCQKNTALRTGATGSDCGSQIRRPSPLKYFYHIISTTNSKSFIIVGPLKFRVRRLLFLMRVSLSWQCSFV